MYLRLLICCACVFCSIEFALSDMKEDLKALRAVICEKDMAFIGNNLVECFQNVSLPLYTEAYTNCCPNVKALNGTEERRNWFCENDTEKLIKCNECTEDTVNKSEKKDEFEEEIKPFLICIADSIQSKETSSNNY